MQHSESGAWAGRWSILVGACLAMIAAGSFVAFSLVARDAGLSGLAGRIEARRLSTTSPVVTLGEPPRNERAGGSDADVNLAAPGPTDMVLGTRFVFDEPIRSTTSQDRKRRHRTGGKGKDTDADGYAPVPARPGSSKPHKTGEAKSKSGGPGPEPQGEANGHDKARGKGHDKHGDH